MMEGLRNFEDVDMSDYGIFVNADGDLVEQGEQELRESFYDEEIDEERRRMLTADTGITAGKNAWDTTTNPAKPKYLCLATDDLETQDEAGGSITKRDNTVTTSFNKERWYCW